MELTAVLENKYFQTENSLSEISGEEARFLAGEVG
jgi:hypothetical protein